MVVLREWYNYMIYVKFKGENLGRKI